MEDYSWILAKNIKGEVIRVRQRKVLGDIFVDEKGNEYQAHHLDLTEARFEFPMDDFKSQMDESNKRFAEQQVEHQELMNKMLSSMDANAIADHKAKIDEREYWRKLRGEIFKECFRRISPDAPVKSACINTQECFNELYNQDKDFFKDK